MRDPQEGLHDDGTIRTGVGPGRVPAGFAPVVDDLVAAFRAVDQPGAQLHLYGSVATGEARVGRSDLDALVVDGAPGWAAGTSAALSERYRDLCRGVEIGETRRADHQGPGDEAYGNRVFLRHYCTRLAGPDDQGSTAPFPGDRRAARGFNGDVAQCLRRWRDGGAAPHRVARKTLFAAAGIVSVDQGGWTTDRATAVAAWPSIEPGEAGAVAGLLEWAEGVVTPSAAELAAALAEGGVVHSVARRFGARIGFWDQLPDPTAFA